MECHSRVTGRAFGETPTPVALLERSRGLDGEPCNNQTGFLAASWI